MAERPVGWRPWAMWGLGVAAYAVAVFQRGSLAVSGLEFQHRFHAGAADLSLLAVLQLGVYAALQVPVGLLLDRLGPRLLIAAGAVFMGVGQGVMAFSHSVPEAVAARVLVGAGDAMTFISALRVVAAWFPPRRATVMTQLTGILGQLGQVVAAYPLVALLRAEGWTASFAGAAVASGIVSLVVLAALRESPSGRRAPQVSDAGSMGRGLREVWAEPGTRMGLWTHFVNQFSGNVFALLWGYPFLVDGEKVSASVAGGLISIMVLVGMGVGPALGGLSGQWPLRRSLLTMIIVGSTAAVWTLVLAWPGRAPLGVLILLVLVLAANGPGSLIGFDYARTFNRPERMGSASGIVNVGGFVASLIMILAVGLTLGGLGGYTLGHFRMAFLVQYLLWAFGLLQVLRTRAVLRARRAAEGVVIDPLHRAVVRRFNRYDRSRTPWSGRRRAK
jgi:MFS family permease